MLDMHSSSSSVEIGLLMNLLKPAEIASFMKLTWVYAVTHPRYGLAMLCLSASFS